MNETLERIASALEALQPAFNTLLADAHKLQQAERQRAGAPAAVGFVTVTVRVPSALLTAWARLLGFGVTWSGVTYAWIIAERPAPDGARDFDVGCIGPNAAFVLGSMWEAASKQTLEVVPA